MKKEALAGKYYAMKQELIDAVNGFIDELNDGVFDEEIRTLLVTKFQTLQTPS
jgi:hypothetical protein